MSSKEAKGISLFDDDDDDVLGDESPEEFDLNLEEKLNRSERKTSKLIELQSKFAHDSRFKIGEHFLDDDEDERKYCLRLLLIWKKIDIVCLNLICRRSAKNGN